MLKQQKRVAHPAPLQLRHAQDNRHTAACFRSLACRAALLDLRRDLLHIYNL